MPGRRPHPVVVVVLVVLVAPVSSQVCEMNDNCFLPNCFCPNRGGHRVAATPGNIPPRDIPQIVSFGFDDAVNTQNIGIYNRLFPATSTNPNGCPISMTLFVSNNFTDYSLVNSLYERGIEIASHSVTHRTPTDFWKNISREDMQFEAGESRRIISTEAGIPPDKIYGWRSPFLQLGGDMSFEVLRDLGYEYDASILVSGKSGEAEQQWPFTLDYGFQLRCQIPPCPKNSHPGFWEIPIVPLEDRENMFPCTYLDSCFFPPMTKKQTLEILYTNFMKNYNNNREPMVINLHASFFAQANFRLEAMERFISSILRLCDVFIVSHHQLLDWVRQPVNREESLTFEPWQCQPDPSTNQ